MSNLAVVYYEEGKYAEAEALASQILVVKSPACDAADVYIATDNLSSVR